MKEIISAAEAARILNCRPQKVRERIKAGRWTFGKAIPPAKPGGQITYKNILCGTSRPQRGADDLDHSKLGGRALT